MLMYTDQGPREICSLVHRKKLTPVRTDAERAYINVSILPLGGDNMQIV